MGDLFAEFDYLFGGAEEDISKGGDQVVYIGVGEFEALARSSICSWVWGSWNLVDSRTVSCSRSMGCCRRSGCELWLNTNYLELASLK